MAAEPTTDQLRDDITSGRTREKVDFPDPAAAPLGTDAEAGGHGVTRTERRLEAASRPVVSDPKPRMGVWPYLLAVLLVGIAAVVIVLLAA